MRVAVAASQFETVGKWTGASYEIRELRDSAREMGLKPVPVPLAQLQFSFPARRPAEALLAGEPLGGLDALIVRRTGAFLDAAQILTLLTLETRGSAMDPIDRFLMGGASKLLSTASRHRRQVGSSTVVVFDPSVLRVCASALGELLGQGPMLAKPMAGAHGEGITAIDDVEALAALADRIDGPFLLQPFEQIEAEYRVMLLDGEPIGIAHKRSISGGPANASQGATFQRVDDADRLASLLTYVESTSPPMGLIGMDVASTPDGYFVIEENFAPEWKALDSALEQRTAMIILSRLLDRSPA